MLSIAPHVRVIADSDGAVVLDLKRNANFGLNPTTYFVWRRLERHVPPEEIVAALATETGESVVNIEPNVTQFIDELRRNRLLVDSWSAFHGRTVVNQALLLFLLYDLCVPPIRILRRRSLWLIHRCVCGWCVASKVVPPGRSAEIVAAVDTACTWYPKQVRCLQRSVATTYLLRKAGVPAKFVVGGTRLPFEEHAWVEVDGKVINDKPEYVGRFIVFERC